MRGIIHDPSAGCKVRDLFAGRDRKHHIRGSAPVCVEEHVPDVDDFWFDLEDYPAKISSFMPYSFHFGPFSTGERSSMP